MESQLYATRLEIVAGHFLDFGVRRPVGIFLRGGLTPRRVAATKAVTGHRLRTSSERGDISMTLETDEGRALLRHTLATLAYRGGKTLRDAGGDFANFRAGEKCRTPLEILAHIGDLLQWALATAKGKKEWHRAKPQSWDEQVGRFFASLKELDEFLSSAEPLGCSPFQLFQAPIADALTHVGQLAMLRNLAGVPIRGENYFVADIAAGRVGAEQSAPRFEF